MKKNILFASFLLFTLMISACGSSTTPTTATQTPIQQEQQTDKATKAPPSKTKEPKVTFNPVLPLFQITRADGTIFYVTLDAAKGLPLVQLTIEDKVREGPKLLDILSLAGVVDFVEVTLTGSNAPITLTRAQLDANTILDLNNPGAIKLVTTYFPKASWTKDITNIAVK